MKYLYRLLLVYACIGWLSASAQNWRPFRTNGDIHAFRGASPDTIFTLRLDSAGLRNSPNGFDSVYYFNRIMRRTSGNQWQKSLNNQFGQQMIYAAAQRMYILVWNGGSVNGFPVGRALVLKPFAQVGEFWMTTDSDLLVSNTLLSRGVALIDGVQDSIATFQVGGVPGGTQVILSKNYGLVSASKDLRISSPSSPILTLARRPAPAGLSYYNPLPLLDLQPGDELGYDYRQFNSSPISCATGTILRRVLTRQLTADSLIYTLQEQSRITYNGPAGCNNTGTVISPVQVVRLAASRRTGRWQWRNSGVMIPLSSPLLAYGYKPLNAGSNDVLMGHPVVVNRLGVTCSGPATLLVEALYRTGTSYGPGLDVRYRQDFSAQGVGAVKQLELELVYTRRTINGTVQTCGSRTNFVTLLPTKAAQRAAAFQLYPNPAAEVVTLTLPAPAHAGTTVRVLDALGRAVVRQRLVSGQTTTVLQLPGLVAGVYVVEVQTAGEAPQRLRLQHQ